MKLDTQVVITPMDEIIRREVDIAWLAGIIDGEGSVHAYFGKNYNPAITNPNQKKLGLELVIVNTDPGIVQKTDEVLRKNGISPILYWLKRSKQNKKCRDLGTIKITGFVKLQKLSVLVLPYLSGYKKEQLAEMISLIQYRQTLPCNNGNGMVKNGGIRVKNKPSILEDPVIQAKVARIKALGQPLNDYTPCPDNG